jgi:hypothetical protein
MLSANDCIVSTAAFGQELSFTVTWQGLVQTESGRLGVTDLERGWASSSHSQMSAIGQ